MGCQKEIAEKIADKQADYILAVKGNQKFLLDDIEEAFSNAKADDEYTLKEVDHGRIETRTAKVITDLDGDMFKTGLEEAGLYHQGIFYTN